MSYQANSVGEKQWIDMIPTDIQVPQGASAPDRVTLPGLPLVDFTAFDGTGTTESVSCSFELNHMYQEGTALSPHVHWCGSNASGGNVVWSLEYSITSMNADEFSAPQTIKAPAVNNPGLGANGRPVGTISVFPDIPGTGRKIGDIIRCRFFRDPNDDTYGYDAIMLQPGLHVQVDTEGSRQKAVK